MSKILGYTGRATIKDVSNTSNKPPPPMPIRKNGISLQWIAWNGDPDKLITHRNGDDFDEIIETSPLQCPCQMVEYRLRNGFVGKKYSHTLAWEHGFAGEYNIVAYRIL